MDYPTDKYSGSKFAETVKRSRQINPRSKFPPGGVNKPPETRKINSGNDLPRPFYGLSKFTPGVFIGLSGG
jgi:hypothetical protein